MRFSDDRGFLCASGSDSIFAIVRFGPELHHSGKRKDRERGAGSRRYHHSLGNPAGRNDRRSGQLLPAAGQKARRGCVAPRLLPGLQVPDPAHRQPHVVRHRAPGGEHLDGRSGRRGLRHHAEKGPDGVALLDRRRSDPQPSDPDHLAGPSGRHAGRDGHPHQLGAGRLGHDPHPRHHLDDRRRVRPLRADRRRGRLDRRRKSQRHREHHRPERRRIGFDLRFSGRGGRHPDHHQAGRQVGRERHL